MPEEPKPKKPEVKKEAWGDSLIVLELGPVLKAQLAALADATGQPMSAIAKAAVEAYVQKRGDLREAAVMQLAERLGLQIDIKKPEKRGPASLSFSRRQLRTAAPHLRTFRALQTSRSRPGHLVASV